MQVEGRNPTIELLKSNHKIESVYIQDRINVDEKIAYIQKLAKQANLQISYIPQNKLNHMSKTDSHQGVIAFVKQSEPPKLEEFINCKKHNLKFIYIKDANHDHNIGAIIRTAECLGFDAVFLPKKIDITPNIIRASMGAFFHIPVFRQSIFQTIKNLSDQGFKIVGIEITPNSKDIFETELSGDIMLIIGDEDKGISQEILKKCNFSIKIPMRGKTNSLNMSVAASLAMFETIRK